MAKIKILLNGCTGKMGLEVIKYLEDNSDFIIAAGVSKDDSPQEKFPIYLDCKNIKEDIDVIIDFSTREAALNILEYAKAKNIPVVLATTGFTQEDLTKIAEYAQCIPILQSYNMSFDILLFQKILREIAPFLTDSDIEIIESHHNQKIDSPSGTALVLADTINAACNNQYHYNFKRLQEKKKREKKEIGFSSIRGGNLVGEHTIKFIGDNEEFTITHTSYSRQVFVEGALKAAQFILNKENGLYKMADLLEKN